MRTSKLRRGFALLQTLIIVMIVISIAMIGIKLTFSGRFSQARAARRDSARAILDSARAEVFACLESAPPYPSATDCAFNANQNACLPAKAGGLDLTVSLVKNKAGDGCLLQLSVDK